MLEKAEECPRCQHDGPLWSYDGQRCASCKYPEPTLQEALAKLNKAAHEAYRIGADTTLYPDLDRQTLREVMDRTGQLAGHN